VAHRAVRFLSPIECSIDDIQTRIRVMREEVAAGIDRRKRNNTQNLMQLVQGSVLPQVCSMAPEASLLLRALQEEIERGFVKMVRGMEPYLSGNEGWADLTEHAAHFEGR
ncbi:hypothetical protein JKP88DRAFT_173418, partial [Tribonema minus]